MAKSAKKSSAKMAKKVAKKPANAVLKKAAKKSAKKVAAKSVKKSARKSAKKLAPRTGKRFLVIYHAPVDAMAQTANISPEDQAAGMALWKAWADRVGSKLADLGAPLINGKRLTTGGSSTPSTREVAGYSLLDAEDWDEVFELLEDHPHLSGWDPEATIEIHETMLMPDM